MKLERSHLQTIKCELKEMIRYFDRMQRQATDWMNTMILIGLKDDPDFGKLRKVRYGMKNRKNTLGNVQAIIKTELANPPSYQIYLEPNLMQYLTYVIRMQIQTIELAQSRMNDVAKDFNRFSDKDDDSIASRHSFDMMNVYRDRREYFKKRKMKLVNVQSVLKQILRGSHEFQQQ